MGISSKCFSKTNKFTYVGLLFVVASIVYFLVLYLFFDYPLLYGLHDRFNFDDYLIVIICFIASGLFCLHTLINYHEIKNTLKLKQYEIYKSPAKTFFLIFIVFIGIALVIGSMFEQDKERTVDDIINEINAKKDPNTKKIEEMCAALTAANSGGLSVDEIMELYKRCNEYGDAAVDVYGLK